MKHTEALKAVDSVLYVRKDKSIAQRGRLRKKMSVSLFLSDFKMTHNATLENSTFHVPLAHLVTKLRKAGKKRLLQFIFMFVFHRTKCKELPGSLLRE